MSFLDKGPLLKIFLLRTVGFQLSPSTVLKLALPTFPVTQVHVKSDRSKVDNALRRIWGPTPGFYRTVNRRT